MRRGGKKTNNPRKNIKTLSLSLSLSLSLFPSHQVLVPHRRLQLRARGLHRLNRRHAVFHGLEREACLFHVELLVVELVPLRLEHLLLLQDRQRAPLGGVLRGPRARLPDSLAVADELGVELLDLLVDTVEFWAGLGGGGAKGEGEG